jgi:hypothetical protein
MYNWTKYDYVCSDCDALIEITTLKDRSECFQPLCTCGSVNVINISVRDANVPDDVAYITAPKLVKINTNPYT